LTRSSLSRIAINDGAVNDRAVNDRAVNDRAVNDRAVNDRAVNDRAVNDRAISTKRDLFPGKIKDISGMAPEETREGSPEEVEESSDSFLTRRQLEVLKLRKQGRPQQEVADILGTSRSNVSILEKRAHSNIARAERTVQQWMMIQAPISLRIKAGTDVFDLPTMIFREADRRSMQLPTNSLDIIVQLRRRAPNLFRKRYVSQDVDLYVTAEGELLLQSPPR
jgi:Tfx family DNA-binding protein